MAQLSPSRVGHRQVSRVYDFQPVRTLAVTIAFITTITVPGVGQRPSCGPTRQPKQLPPASALVDSSAAIMELQAARVLRDSMQFTMLVHAGDSIPLIHAIDSTDHLAAAVIARSVWPQKPAQLWAVRLDVTGGPTPAVAVARATYCPPELTAASSQPVRMTIGIERTTVTSGAYGLPTPPPRLYTVFEIQVTERGDVSNVKLIRSSGYDAIDQQISQHIWQDKYEPALIDGIPIPAVYRTDKNSARP